MEFCSRLGQVMAKTLSPLDDPGEKNWNEVKYPVGLDRVRKRFCVRFNCFCQNSNSQRETEH